MNRRTRNAAHHAGLLLAHAALGPRTLLRHTLTIGRRVQITYRKENGETSVRIIDPVDVRRSKAGDWYVRAHDHLRDDKRSFRLDRISTYTQAA